MFLILPSMAYFGKFSVPYFHKFETNSCKTLHILPKARNDIVTIGDDFCHAYGTRSQCYSS